ncbi:MAG: sigma-70 family RNA polymerase sigma factor [Phycisphaerales bacterium]
MMTIDTIRSIKVKAARIATDPCAGVSGMRPGWVSRSRKVTSNGGVLVPAPTRYQNRLKLARAFWYSDLGEFKSEYNSNVTFFWSRSFPTKGSCEKVANRGFWHQLQESSRIGISGWFHPRDSYLFGGRVGGSTMADRRINREQAALDISLMQRVAAGDEKAVAELYDRFGSLVYKMAFQSMPTRAEAEDAVQEIFVRLWRTAARYDAERAALVTWVMLISRRQLVDRMRRTRARIRPTALDESTPVAVPDRSEDRSVGEREENMKEMLRRIDALPELQRTVVKRAYLGGQTLRQIGEELNTPLGTIKSALSRALTRLRERGSEEFAV